MSRRTYPFWDEVLTKGRILMAGIEGLVDLEPLSGSCREWSGVLGDLGFLFRIDRPASLIDLGRGATK
jgi:hypothetical protein